MKKAILLLVVSASISHAQLFSFQSGSGVPTDTAMGGLLGMLIAPMISKGPDAKLVGGLIGAAAMNAVATANHNHQQQMTQDNVVNTKNPYQRQMVSQGYDRPALGIRQGKMVRSPYSPFTFDPASMSLRSGETLFDPFTGQPIVIP
jgi:hypothetical protein